MGGSDGKKSSHDAARARLTASYLSALGLCIMMISWVAVAPGSCTTSRLAAAATGWRGGDGDGGGWSAAAAAAAASAFIRRRYDEDFLATSASKYVPPTLITKYRAHPLVCAAHVLPSALWSALAPLQLNPNLRRQRPRLHRLSGRVFVSTALLMSGGYALIHCRDLHFHANDFPSLAGGEALSLAVPGLWTWLGGGGWGGGGGGGGVGQRGTGDDDDDAALSAFLIFEHSAAAWFAATAVMTLWSAWWGSRRSCSARGKGGVPQGREWVVAHRAWAVRHVAAGLSVATQRVVISLAHGACAAAAASSEAFDTSFCSSPATQKGIFADSLVIGTAVCLITAEVAVRDLSAVSKMVPEGEKDGEKDGAPVGHLMTKKRD